MIHIHIKQREVYKGFFEKIADGLAEKHCFNILETQLKKRNEEINIGATLAALYYLITAFNLFQQTSDIIRGNIMIYKTYTAKNLPLVSKALAVWEEEIFNNHLQVRKDKNPEETKTRKK